MCASFTPWQQAKIEIMLAISLTIACSRYMYYGVILHAHPVHGESHNQHNTTGEVATTSPPFYKEPHRSHVLCVKAWTCHDPHILVTAPFCCDRKSRAACAQSFAPWQQATIEIMLAISLTIACSLHVLWCYSSCTSRSWCITQSTQPHQRGCNTWCVMIRSRCSFHCVYIIVHHTFTVRLSWRKFWRIWEANIADLCLFIK